MEKRRDPGTEEISWAEVSSAVVHQGKGGTGATRNFPGTRKLPSQMQRDLACLNAESSGAFLRVDTKCICVCVFSSVQLFVTPWTIAHQAPLPMRFPRQGY